MLHRPALFFSPFFPPPSPQLARKVGEKTPFFFPLRGSGGRVDQSMEQPPSPLSYLLSRGNEKKLIQVPEPFPLSRRPGKRALQTSASPPSPFLVRQDHPSDAAVPGSLSSPNYRGPDLAVPFFFFFQKQASRFDYAFFFFPREVPSPLWAARGQEREAFH